jgi:hypothetical protein
MPAFPRCSPLCGVRVHFLCVCSIPCAAWCGVCLPFWCGQQSVPAGSKPAAASVSSQQAATSSQRQQSAASASTPPKQANPLTGRPANVRVFLWRSKGLRLLGRVVCRLLVARPVSRAERRAHCKVCAPPLKPRAHPKSVALATTKPRSTPPVNQYLQAAWQRCGIADLGAGQPGLPAPSASGQQGEARQHGLRSAAASTPPDRPTTSHCNSKLLAHILPPPASRTPTSSRRCETIMQLRPAAASVTKANLPEVQRHHCNSLTGSAALPDSRVHARRPC